MFKTVKRIIDWCGEFKGKLYLGFVMTFFSHIFATMPLALAAYTVGLLIESQQAGTPFDTSWIWKCIVIQVALVLLRFLFDYFRARLQEPISYQLTARDRLAIGDALKRVSLGYFQQVSTGNILSSITTGQSTLENMGIRMIDNFVGGYLNFLVIFVCLAVCSPVTALIAPPSLPSSNSRNRSRPKPSTTAAAAPTPAPAAATVSARTTATRRTSTRTVTTMISMKPGTSGKKGGKTKESFRRNFLRKLFASATLGPQCVPMVSAQ